MEISKKRVSNSTTTILDTMTRADGILKRLKYNEEEGISSLGQIPNKKISPPKKKKSRYEAVKKITIKITKVGSGRYKATMSNGHTADIDFYEGKWTGAIEDENGEREASISGSTKREIVQEIHNYYAV